MKKALHEKLFMLSRMRGISQTDLAARTNVTLSHINRYFSGKASLSSEHFVKLLNVLGVNIEELVDEKVKLHAQLVEGDVENVQECLGYLFNRLDPLGQQTFLNSLAWANRVSNKKKLPVKVEELLKREISLI